MKKKHQKKILGQKHRRQGRVRAKLQGTAERPRLAVRRSLSHISAQLINDAEGKTLVSAHDREVKSANKTEMAGALGTLLAEKAKKAGVDKVVFDRRHYKYHGRVKAFADAARQAGLEF